MNNKLWENNFDSVSTDKEKPQRSLFDNIGDAITAIGANFNDVRGSERLGDLRRELEDRTLSPEEFEAKAAEYDREYAEREAARQRYQAAQNNLVADDSFLKNVTQMGGTLEGMAAQGIGTAVGAGVGFLSPFVGGTAMGAKIGNAAGAVAGGYLDARSVALQAEEDVLNNGGTWEQAKRAYDETLKKASLTTLPETLVDIAMGNRLVGSALNSRAARKIAGSTLGRVGSSIIDPAAKVGTAVSRATRPIIGRAAGLATDVALQGSTEALQEVAQDYIADREVAKAMQQADNEYSLGGFGRYATSEQGLETMKTAGIMGALFGGVGGTLSSGQYLQRGSYTVMGNKAYNAVESMVQDGSIELDKEKREAIEDYIHHVTGKSQAELSTWSDGDIISQYASSFAERFNPGSNEDMNYSIVRGVVEGVKDTVVGDEARGSRENDLTTTAEKVLERMGVDADIRQKLFVSSAEQSVIEKAKQAEQTETKTESGDSAIKMKLSPKLAEEVKNNDGKTVQEVHQEEVAAKQGTPVQSAKTTDGVIGEVSYKDNIGEEWTRVPYTTQSGQELDGVRYHNNKTGKNAIITKRNDGQFFVMDEDNTTGRVVPTLEKAEAILSENKNERRMFQSDDTQETESPTVPEDGVNADTSGNTGVRISNIHDLSKFMDENPNSIDPEWLRQFISVTQRIAPENWEMYLDVNNYGYVYDKESGKWGKVRGWADTNKQNSMGRAIFQLYRGADIGTAIHEIAHHGYWNLSEEDRRIFNNYAVKSVGKFIANILGRNYDNTFIAELRNIKQGDELFNKIIENACLNQVMFLLNSLNLQSLNIQDKNSMTLEQIEAFNKNKQAAIEERWAWEFSNWYAEGYVKGYTGDNVIERILQRGCVSMASALNGIQKLWEHLHRRNSENETPVEDLYRGMNSTRNEVEQQVEQQQYEQESEEEYSEPTYQETETTEESGFDNSVFTIPEEQFDDIRTSPVNQDNVGINPWNRRRANPLVTVNNSIANQNEYGLSNLNNSVGEYTGGQRENREPSTMIGGRIMNDTTAEIVADEMLRRYGNDYDEMKRVWTSLYDNAENDEERRWFTKIAKIAGQKYQQNRKGVAKTNRSKSNNPGQLNEGTKQINQNQRQSNIVPYENRTQEMTFGSNGLQANTLPLDTMRFGSNELRATPINEQTLNEVNRLAEENRQKESPKTQDLESENITETQEVESQEQTNEIGDEVESVVEEKSGVYNIELEPQEVESIKDDAEEILEILDGESDKTVKKIKTSINRRASAAKSELRNSTNALDKEQGLYKLSLMQSIENILNSRLNNNYYESGDLNQNKVNQTGNEIKKILGEIYGDKRDKELDSDPEVISMKEEQQNIEKLGEENVQREEKIEKERKEKEKEEKKKKKQEEKNKKKQEEAYLKNLEKMEQYANETENQELTDEQAEEKAEEWTREQQQNENTPKSNNKKTTFKTDKERREYMKERAKRLGIYQTGKDTVKQGTKEVSESDRVVNGWVERFLEKGDYNDAMYELQELLDRGTITEEEYNKIQQRLENALGDEDYSSGRQYQRARDEELSPKAQQAQQILNKTFPGRRFQYAWHSTPHDFDAFTLEHLLSGEGAMAHGWGLYFARSLKKNKKNYYDRLGNKRLVGDFDIIIEDDTLDYEDYKEFKRELSRLPEGTKRLISNKEDVIAIYEGYVASTNAQIEALKELIKTFKENHETSPTKINISDSSKLRELEVELDDSYSNLDDYEWMLYESKYIKRINYIRENGNKLILVDIPNDDVLLREEMGFHYQPKKVQDALIKLVRAEGLFIDDEVSNKDLFENFDLYMGVDNDIYDTISWMYQQQNNVSIKKSKEMCSKALNLYGIKGISYNGRRDGECAVIFDDKAIDIITKFRQEEGKWKSEKINNARNREADKEKAQRKLEKHNNKLSEKAQRNKQILEKAFPGRRFQYAWHSTPHDFDEFTLDHLLSGEGFMAHGWGLYFAKSLRKNKERYFDRLGKQSNSIPKIYINGINVTKVIKSFYWDLINSKNETNFMKQLQAYRSDVTKELNAIQSGEFYNEDFGELYTYGDTKFYLSPVTDELIDKNNKEQMDKYISDLKKWDGLSSKIQDLAKKHGIKIVKPEDNNKNKLLLVDIPNDDVLLKEDKQFYKQPKSVQKGLVNFVKNHSSIITFPNWDYERYTLYIGEDEVPMGYYKDVDLYYDWVENGLTEEQFINVLEDEISSIENHIKEKNIKEDPNDDVSLYIHADLRHKKKLLERLNNGESFRWTNKPLITDKFLLENFDSLFGSYYESDYNIYDQLVNSIADNDDEINWTQGYVSRELNKYGIKGISYYGQLDGRCAVVFDDTAIDIITKFKKEEGKWKSEKVDNSRNRQVDYEKAERKLEKHNIKNSRRFMLASEKRDNATLADTNTPQFKKWFGKSTAVKADGSPRVFYRGQGHEYNPDYNFSKTDANRNKLTWVAQSKGFVERGQYNGENGQGDLWEVYIKAENPFYIGLIDSSSDQAEKNPKTLYEDLKKRMGREAKYGRITKKQLEEFLKKIDYLRQGKRSDGKVSTENGPVYYYLDKDTTLVNAIKDLGYDSIMGIEDNTNTYALFEPTQVKSIYNKGTFDENNRDIRYQMGEAEKTPLEKAKEQRDARLEQQRKAGITSDVYKDVYSVIFEKDSTNNEENKRKMEYFDKRSEYWDRHEKGGRVTYTRKTPFEHHQQVIRYSGINGVEKTEKPKSKPAQWAEWLKDQIIKYAFNDLHFLAKAARKLGVYDTYTKMIVTKGYALKANTAMQNGIKYNGKNTRALNDIIREIGEEKQKDFIDYCIAKRILDMEELRPEIKQKMSPDEAREIIERVENGKDAKLFMKNQKDFVEYNHALLHVLVDGGIMTEEEFQKFLKKDPNFVPLAKVMDDADFGFNCIQSARSIVNVKSPIKKIGTSMREVKNPFLEMQKRTAEYYAIASRNKAGQIFVNEIAGVLDKNAKGDTIAKGQSMIRKIKVDEKDGKLITKPNEQEQIIFICNNGVNEFYQVSDPEIYRALRALDADQMGTLHKMIDPFLHAPSALIRETATMVPDFGIRNLIRDGGEAFLTSEHGFLPFIDQIWGMYQMANNTEWYQRFLEQQGEYGTYNRDSVNDNIVRVEDTVDEKVNPWKNFQALRESYMNKFTNKKNSKATRALALLQLVGSMPYAIVKSNKRINDYLEMGTRVAEFKNAKMGYEGTLDRLSQGGIFDWDATLSNAKQSDIIAAGAAKEITLNFGQHGIIGKQLNRYIPFFNATLQGIYKLCNSLQLLFTGTTLSGEKNRKLQSELLFKAALTVAMGIGVAAAGEGDDDYEEANQYEKENFWILPNGLRFPKDQVLGKLFGNVAEKSYTQWRKGKFEPSDILKSIIENFTPDKFMPAMADIVLGGYFNYDSFYKSPIVPEYMQGKLGHLQKDLSTSNMATDVSDALWKYFHTDVSAKRLDWALQKNFTNVKKYVDAMYDLGKKIIAPETFNEKMARGYDKSDSTGEFVGGLKDDVPKPLSLITGTFATNRTNYKSISDFYERYNELKRLSTDEASMTKEQKRKWKKYEDAYKKDKLFRKQLRAIKQDSSLTGKQKREKADKIFKQQIKLAKWAEG